MDLKAYFNKEVMVTCVNGRVFIGKVDDFIFAEDNNLGQESIIVSVEAGDLYEFTEDDIEKIVVL